MFSVKCSITIPMDLSKQNSSRWCNKNIHIPWKRLVNKHNLIAVQRKDNWFNRNRFLLLILLFLGQDLKAAFTKSKKKIKSNNSLRNFNEFRFYTIDWSSVNKIKIDSQVFMSYNCEMIDFSSDYLNCWSYFIQ